MNIKEMFKGQYSDEELNALQKQYDKKVLKSYNQLGEGVIIDPIEELDFPVTQAAEDIWALQIQGFTDWITANMDQLMASKYRLVIGINDTGAMFNPWIEFAQYEVVEWRRDNTGTGFEDNHNHSHNVGSVAFEVLRPMFEAGKAVFFVNKLLDRGSGSLTWIAKGCEQYADIEFEENDIVIPINSYGATGLREHARTDAAIAASQALSHIWTASSGNSGNDPNGTSRVGYPANKPNVLAVGATRPDDTIQPYSSTGEEVYIVAGSGFICVNRDGSKSLRHGTSFSGPFVAAVIGLLQLYYDKRFTQADVDRLVAGNALNLGAPGRDRIFGYGIIKGPSIKENLGDAPDNPDNPDQPDNPDNPDTPPLPKYTAEIELYGLRELYAFVGSPERKYFDYGRYILQVETTEEIDATRNRINAIMQDWMRRHYVQFPDNWSVERVVSYLALVTDRYLTDNMKIVSSVKEVQVMDNEDATSSFVLRGEQLKQYKTAPQSEIDAVQMVALDITEILAEQE
jgi:hypothetical protein